MSSGDVDKAAMCLRKSPGGRMPNSLRKTPLDPPSSAMVKTEVRP